jgi:hypothetical protein
VALEVFKGANEVDDAGDAEVFSGSGAGFYGNWAERSGAAFGEDDTVDAGAVRYAEKCAQILRVFNAVKGEDQAARRRIGRAVGLVEVLDGEELGGANESDDALMCGSLSELGQLLAGLVANADAGLTTEGNELIEPRVLALVSYEDVVEAATAGLDRLFNRMHAVENFHRDSVEDWRSAVGGEVRPIGLFHGW